MKGRVLSPNGAQKVKMTGMSSAVLPAYLSLEEFLARPEREDDQREELIEGELIVSPSPKTDHHYVVEQLRDAFPLKSQGLVFTQDFSCILGTRSMPQPDLGVIEREKFNKTAREKAWMEGAPLLAIGVNSPSNRRPGRKAEIYLDHGAEQAWVVNPKKRTITVYTAEGSSEARLGECVEFHGITVKVDEIFPE